MQEQEVSEVIVPPISKFRRNRVRIIRSLSVDEIPEITALKEQAFAEPLSAERRKIINSYYPHLDPSLTELIERTMKYGFRKFQMAEEWAQTYARNARTGETILEQASRQPRIATDATTDASPLEERLKALHQLGINPLTNAAFGPLADIERFLSIDGDASLEEQIKQKSNEQPCEVFEIGCGGQSASIELLAKPDFLDNRNIHITGVGAFDYGKNVRAAFPEFAERLSYTEKDIFSDELPVEVADFVFSTRTIAYTEVRDFRRFCLGCHQIAKNSGEIIIGGIMEMNLNFKDSPFKNIGEYLVAMQKSMPSLKFQRRKEDNTYVVHWKKSEGFPFDALQAKEVINNEKTNLPSIVIYCPINSD